MLLSHRINAAITQTISAGHEIAAGSDSNFIVLNYVRHTATWNIINDLLLATEGFYETGDDIRQPICGGHSALRWCGYLWLPADAACHAWSSLSVYSETIRSARSATIKQNSVSLDGTYSF